MINLAEAVKLKSILGKKVQELISELHRSAFVTVEKGQTPKTSNRAMKVRRCMSFVHWIAIMKNQQNRHPGKEQQSQSRSPQQQQQQMDAQQPQKGGKQQEQRQQGSQKHPQQR